MSVWFKPVSTWIDVAEVSKFPQYQLHFILIETLSPSYGYLKYGITRSVFNFHFRKYWGFITLLKFVFNTMILMVSIWLPTLILLFLTNLPDSVEDHAKHEMPFDFLWVHPIFMISALIHPWFMLNMIQSLDRSQKGFVLILSNVL